MKFVLGKLYFYLTVKCIFSFFPFTGCSSTHCRDILLEFPRITDCLQCSTDNCNRVDVCINGRILMRNSIEGNNYAQENWDPNYYIQANRDPSVKNNHFPRTLNPYHQEDYYSHQLYGTYRPAYFDLYDHKGSKNITKINFSHKQPFYTKTDYEDSSIKIKERTNPDDSSTIKFNERTNPDEDQKYTKADNNNDSSESGSQKLGSSINLDDFSLLEKILLILSLILLILLLILLCCMICYCRCKCKQETREKVNDCCSDEYNRCSRRSSGRSRSTVCRRLELIGNCETNFRRKQLSKSRRVRRTRSLDEKILMLKDNQCQTDVKKKPFKSHSMRSTLVCINPNINFTKKMDYPGGVLENHPENNMPSNDRITEGDSAETIQTSSSQDVIQDTESENEMGSTEFNESRRGNRSRTGSRLHRSGKSRY